MPAPLSACLALVRANAALLRRIDGRLGSFHGISFSDFGILLELSRAPGGKLRRVDLAAAVGLTQSAVTRALIPLEKIGLVSRRPDPNDARVGYAVLTAAGKRRVDDSRETVDAITAEAVAGVEDLASFAQGLEGLARI